MNPETNLQRTFRETGDSLARVRAENANDPMQAAMAEAMRLTSSEQKELDAAQDAVREAEEGWRAAGFALAQAQRGQEPTYDPKRPSSFFRKSPAAHKAAARAAAGGLRIDLEEARMELQAAIRRRNDVLRRVEEARWERRRAAKLKHTPPQPKAQPVGDFFAPKGGLR